jgi:hypothetical protein
MKTRGLVNLSIVSLLLLSVVGLQCDHDSENSPTLVPIVVEKFSQDSPGTEAGRMVYDRGRNSLVYVSGSPFQIWEWQSDHWIRITTNHQPASLEWFEIIYCPPLAATLLLGRESSATTRVSSPQMWRYDGADWSRLDDSAGGPPYSGGKLAWDPTMLRIYYTAAQTWLSNYEEHDNFAVWTFDGQTWWELPDSAVQPPSFSGEVTLGFDVIRSRLVFCGYRNLGCGSSYKPVWEYDGQNWVELNIDGGIIGTTIQDEQRHRLLILENSSVRTKLSEYQAGTWNLVNETTDFSVGFTAAYDSSEDALYAYDSGFTMAYHQGSGWSQQNRSTTPPNSANVLAAFFPPLNVSVFLVRSDFYSAFARRYSTWTWNGSAFQSIDSPLIFESDFDLSNGALVYEEDRQRLVLILIGWSTAVGVRTFAFDGSAWSDISPPQAERPRLRGLITAAWYSKDHAIVLYPWEYAAGPADKRWRTLEFNNDAWTEAITDNSAGPVYGGLLTELPDIEQLVLFGGGTTPIYEGDCLNGTWLFDGQTWTNQPVSVAPGFRKQMIGGFDRNLGHLFIAGGGCSGQSESDLWEWWGDFWRSRDYEGPRLNRIGAAVANDTVRRVTVIYGGTNNGETLGSLLELEFHDPVNL